LRGRRFAGTTVTFEKMSGANDVISRFRDLEKPNVNTISAKKSLTNYLATCAPKSRQELAQHILE